MENTTKNSIFSSLWFWWIILTFIYLFFSLVMPAKDASIFGSIVRTVGLFVPFGIWNSFFAFVTLKGFITLVLFIIFTYFINKNLNKYEIFGFKRIIFNIILLLVMTLMVDLIIYQKWQSYDFLINGGTRGIFQ